VADFSSGLKTIIGYFHSLGKILTEATQNVYESRFKSSHNVRLGEIWSDSIAFAPDFTSAYNESLTNPSVTYYNQVTLTQIAGSNGQTWYFDSGGTFVRPWISPVDVPNTVSNLPSDGYQVQLFKNDGSPVYLTDGAWVVDYYGGIIRFAPGYTPTDLGYGTPKVSMFVYTGNFGASGSTIGGFSKVSLNNNYMSSRETNSGDTLACIIPILSEPILGSKVRVLLNGVELRVGSGSTFDCYFSPDGNIIRSPGTEQTNDYLYWNYDNGTPVAKYELDSLDILTFNYLIK